MEASLTSLVGDQLQHAIGVLKAAQSPVAALVSERKLVVASYGEIAADAHLMAAEIVSRLAQHRSALRARF